MDDETKTPMTVLQAKLVACDEQIERLRWARRVLVKAIAKQERLDRKQAELTEEIDSL